MKRYNSYQMPVGEAGWVAIRLVRLGGTIIWRHNKYQSDFLSPYEGKEIFLWDKDGSLQIHEGGWDYQDRPITWGKWICDI